LPAIRIETVVTVRSLRGTTPAVSVGDSRLLHAQQRLGFAAEDEAGAFVGSQATLGFRQLLEQAPPRNRLGLIESCTRFIGAAEAMQTYRLREQNKCAVVAGCKFLPGDFEMFEAAGKLAQTEQHTSERAMSRVLLVLGHVFETALECLDQCCAASDLFRRYCR